jgi:hypothetical protein
MGAEILVPVAMVVVGGLLIGGLIWGVKRMAGAVDRERSRQLEGNADRQEKARGHLSKPTTGDHRSLAARLLRRRKRVQDGDSG